MAQTMVVRRTAAVTFALAGLAGAFIAGTGAAADATQGQAVIAGQTNTETALTVIQNQGTGTGATGDGLDAFANGAAGAVGVYGSGPFGVFGLGSSIGVEGDGLTGVFGKAIGAGDGVSGRANNSCCSAVFGLNSGTGNGVAGQANDGTGVLAASTNGTALKVAGTAQFSRSGVATVTGTSTTPRKSVKVTLPVTAKSMVLATLQKRVAGVYVVAAVPNVGGGYFTIFLNKSVTTSVGPIAWQVIERP